MAERRYPMSEVRGVSQEELPHVPGQRWPLRGATPCPRSGMVARRSCSMPEARDGGWEEQPHVQGAVAAWAQEGLEELFHIKRREGQW